MKDKMTIAVVGAGSRGGNYSKIAREAFGDKVKIVAVAEPREFFRNDLADASGIAQDMRFESWRELAKLPRVADAVIVATQDRMHTEPALAFLKKGYHMLLEKPMAPTEAECRKIVAAAKKSGRLFAVCHVLRYTRYFKKLRELALSGIIGDIVTARHIESVTYWHQAHSFVRGNWRNRELSSPMILQKCCHDMDILLYILGKDCEKLSSFGSLKHFKKENQPAGAADRCMECKFADSCLYSAKRFYLGRAKEGNFAWPVDVITEDRSVGGVEKALREGPYGRCVYACDNTVVDNQVVDFQFSSGVTANFTMTAFTPNGMGRETDIMGTKGFIRGDSKLIKVCKFDGDAVETIDINKGVDANNILSGHGGGDGGIIEAFVKAVLNEDQAQLCSGPDDSLQSHLMSFAAEKSREREGAVQKIRL